MAGWNPEEMVMKEERDGLRGKASAKKLTKKEVDAALLHVAKAKPGPTFFRELGDKVMDTANPQSMLPGKTRNPQRETENSKSMQPPLIARLPAECLAQSGLSDTLRNPRRDFRLPLKCWMQMAMNKLKRKNSLRIHANIWKLQRIIGKEDDLKAAGDETVLRETELDSCGVNTVLLVHFFGRQGKEKLRFSEFFRFMENLQTEVQEMEFIKFSKGLSVMRKEDFVAWLLYFTDEENNEIYWQNVKDRIETGENISLEEFKTFCKFTNNLEDFSIAMQMFTVANRPVKRAEFKRAVKVATGQDLSDNVLDTIFKIFDLDGDDCLSHSEFLGVLRNRIHRGLRVPQQQGIQGFWKCVKKESIKEVKELWKQTGKSPF
ncbi:calcium uptake protein 2, mitochondrial [Agelaius tricolor]|uniref:calcium uptake protein 2, mitochondrial n=1 Tax=Agelaius tricolor TaxID=9191 RepID=UPI0039F1AD46